MCSNDTEEELITKHQAGGWIIIAYFFGLICGIIAGATMVKMILTP
jgi:hypothetical protein